MTLRLTLFLLSWTILDVAKSAVMRFGLYTFEFMRVRDHSDEPSESARQLKGKGITYTGLLTGYGHQHVL